VTVSIGGNDVTVVHRRERTRFAVRGGGRDHHRDQCDDLVATLRTALDDNGDTTAHIVGSRIPT